MFRSQACLRCYHTDLNSQANSSLDRSGRARQTTCSWGATMQAESYRADPLLPVMR